MTHPREPLEAHLLATLSLAMREKLAERRHHGDWRDETAERLLLWLRDEVRELGDALAQRGMYANDIVMANIRSECADVALLAGIIWDSVERAPLRAGDTEAARWAERNRVLEARLQAVREVVR